MSLDAVTDLKFGDEEDLRFGPNEALKDLGGKIVEQTNRAAGQVFKAGEQAKEHLSNFTGKVTHFSSGVFNSVAKAFVPEETKKGKSELKIGDFEITPEQFSINSLLNISNLEFTADITFPEESQSSAFNDLKRNYQLHFEGVPFPANKNQWIKNYRNLANKIEASLVTLAKLHIDMNENWRVISDKEVKLCLENFFYILDNEKKDIHAKVHEELLITIEMLKDLGCDTRLPELYNLLSGIMDASAQYIECTARLNKVEEECNSFINNKINFIIKNSTGPLKEPHLSKSKMNFYLGQGLLIDALGTILTVHSTASKLFQYLIQNNCQIKLEFSHNATNAINNEPSKEIHIYSHNNSSGETVVECKELKVDLQIAMLTGGPFGPHQIASFKLDIIANITRGTLTIKAYEGPSMADIEKNMKKVPEKLQKLFS